MRIPNVALVDSHWCVGHRDGQPPTPDSHPEITSIRSLEEAHSSVTPGQDAKRSQPGESSGQGKSASERLTSISDAHSQRGPHNSPNHPSIVVAAPCAGQQGTCIQLPEDVFLQALVHKDVGRHKARPLQLTMVWCGRSNERPYGLSVVRCSTIVRWLSTISEPT